MNWERTTHTHTNVHQHSFKCQRLFTLVYICFSFGCYATVTLNIRSFHLRFFLFFFFFSSIVSFLLPCIGACICAVLCLSKHNRNRRSVFFLFLFVFSFPQFNILRFKFTTFSFSFTSETYFHVISNNCHSFKCTYTHKRTITSIVRHSCELLFYFLLKFFKLTYFLEIFDKHFSVTFFQ